MFIQDDIKESLPLFIVELYHRTLGDGSVKVSMYDIGESLGLDRKLSLRTAEELIGTGLAEIKTLSGGIGITADGVTEAQQLGASLQDIAGSNISLQDVPILDESGHQAVEQVVTELKGQTSQYALDFDSLAELMADLKTIDAQLSSPNPKTAIIRECFRSIVGLLQSMDNNDSLKSVKILLGE
ncbi:MAG: hypothetical protein WBZ05_16225 [Desulfobacterales bacterium]|jgi:hypothetical protein